MNLCPIEERRCYRQLFNKVVMGISVSPNTFHNQIIIRILTRLFNFEGDFNILIIFYTGINIYFNKHVLQKISRNKYIYLKIFLSSSFTAEMLIKILHEFNIKSVVNLCTGII